MKKSDKLKQLLRQIIREEVTEQVNKAMGKILVEVLKESRKIPPSPTVVEEEKTNRPLPLTKNEALNAVLAETARTHTHLPNNDEGVSLAQLMGDGFDKVGQNEKAVTTPTTKIDFLKQIVNESATSAQGSVTDSPAVPEMLKKVFKKDFRAIMKKMEDQKKEGNQGLYAGKVSLGG
jgi:hypothetical protein